MQLKAAIGTENQKEKYNLWILEYKINLIQNKMWNGLICFKLDDKKKAPWANPFPCRLKIYCKSTVFKSYNI